MSNEEMNRRCQFFAKFDLPYSDIVWRLLAEAFEHGYDAHKKGEQHRNPYQAVLCRGDGPGVPLPLQGAPRVGINPDGAYGQEMGLPRTNR